jgi:uncharacterized protein (TIGR00369 family)
MKFCPCGRAHLVAGGTDATAWKPQNQWTEYPPHVVIRERTAMPSFSLPALTPGYRADLASAIESMPASRLVGLTVMGFAPEGLSVVSIPVTHAVTFDGQVVQGGIVGMLADYAGVSAASCTLPGGWLASTTAFEVHNLAPAKGDRLLAIGRAVHVGKSQAVSSAEVWAIDGEASTLVAWATTTGRFFEIRRPTS